MPLALVMMCKQSTPVLACLAMTPAFKFGRIEADGDRIHVHVRVTIAGFWEHPFVVSLSEDDAMRLIAQVQTAIAKLGRTRLGPASR